MGKPLKTSMDLDKLKGKIDEIADKLDIEEDFESELEFKIALLTAFIEVYSDIKSLTDEFDEFIETIADMIELD